jgi:hypothetical protein
MASTLRAMGRLDEAKEQFYELLPHALEYNEQQRLMTLTDDYAAILTDVGDHHSSVHLLGAADAMRERLAIPRMRTQREAPAETLAKTHAALAPQEWHNAYQTGSSTTVEEALRLSREKHSPGQKFPRTARRPGWLGLHRRARYSAMAPHRGALGLACGLPDVHPAVSTEDTRLRSTPCRSLRRSPTRS